MLLFCHKILFTPTTTMLLCVGFLILFAADLHFSKPSWMLIETKDSDDIEKSFKKYIGGLNKQHSGGGSDYTDYDILGDLLGGLGGGKGGGGLLGILTNLFGENNKTLQESWNSLKTEIRSYKFEPIITMLHNQSQSGDLGKVLDAIDKNKILDAIDTEKMGGKIRDFLQKQIDKKIMTELLKKAHKFVQHFDEFNITEGIYPEKLVEGVNLNQIWKGINFGKILSAIKMICKSIDLSVSLKGVKMKNLAGVLNPKEFSNKLGEKIVKIMEKIEGQGGLIDKAGSDKAGSDKAGPTGGVVKESENLNITFKNIVDTKKIVDAIDVPKLLEGLNLKIFDLIGVVDIAKIINIAGDSFNIFTKISGDAPPTDAGSKAGDEGSGVAPAPSAGEGTTAGN